MVEIEEMRMKLRFFGVAAFLSVVTMTASVYAQEDYNEGLKEELNQEIDQLNPSNNSNRKSAPGRRVQNPPQVRQQNQPIYILQQPAPVQAQAQPTTTIEATPLSNSRTDQLR